MQGLPAAPNRITPSTPPAPPNPVRPASKKVNNAKRLAVFFAVILGLGVVGKAVQMASAPPDFSSAPAVDAPAPSRADILRVGLETMGIDTLSDFSSDSIDRMGQVTCKVARRLHPFDKTDKVQMWQATASSLHVPTVTAAKINGAFMGAYCPDVAGG